MTIGENIKIFRKRKHLTQSELADKANISRSYLADLERNRYNPSVETLKSIARALKVSESDLLNEVSTTGYEKDNFLNITNEVEKISIGRKIEQLREGKGWSQQEFANKLDLALPTISQFETNERKPSIKTINMIADIFNVEPSYFSDEDSEDKEFLINARKMQFLNPDDRKSVSDYINYLLQKAKNGE